MSRNALTSYVTRMMQPLQRRVMLMVGRAVLRAVNDETTLQSLKIELLADEVKEGTERFQEYGFTSHPHDGAEAVTVFMGGNRDHGLVIAVDDRRYRLKALEQGEVALYTDEGQRVHLRRNKEIFLASEMQGDPTKYESSLLLKPDRLEVYTPEIFFQTRRSRFLMNDDGVDFHVPRFRFFKKTTCDPLDPPWRCETIAPE